MLRSTILLHLLLAATVSAQQLNIGEQGPPPGAPQGQKPPSGGAAGPGQQPPPGGPPGPGQTPPPGGPPGPGQKPPPGGPPVAGGPPGGQPPPWVIPRYRLLREEEDWSYLADPKMRGHDPFDPMKYIGLGKPEQWYLTLGGEAREWFESYKNENWGVLPFRPPDADDLEPEHNAYLKQRYMFHGDFHLGPRVRMFGQLKSSVLTGRTGGPRPIIDSDELDVNQAFVDVNVLLTRQRTPRVTLRVGRQEMHFGTGRLVSAREGPNVRAPFDGFRVIARVGAWRVDNWAVKPVITLGKGVRYPPFPVNRNLEPARGYFDDRPDEDQKFWGTFATGAVRGLPFNIDAYYLGLKRKTGIYAQGIGPEKRNTIGGRIWHGGVPFVLGRGWDYDLEYAYQFGKFGPGPRLGVTFPFLQFPEGDIRAWTIATQTGYTFNSVPTQPRIAVNAGITTGDKDPTDPDLQTFFTPYPNGRSFGAAQQNGPLNIQGLRPNITIQLPRRASVTVDAYFFWRYSRNDGIYSIPGLLLRPGDLTRSRYIGTQPGLELNWPVNKHLTMTGLFAYFVTGEFLRDNPPAENLVYLGAILAYRF